MEEIQVGEYVRTAYGISKVIENVDKYVTKEQISVDLIGDMYHQVIYINNVLNHSKNIIDLIEVGDFVNGQEVVTVYGYDKDGNDKDELGIVTYDGDDEIYYYLTDVQIREVLTHEMYSQNCYKVVE